MKFKKKRKPRGTKLNGSRSLDLCPCCLSYNCDPFTMSAKFYKKINNRRNKGLCPACGNDPCTCKSSRTLI
jgi:hypothetical protein